MSKFEDKKEAKTGHKSDESGYVNEIRYGVLDVAFKPKHKILKKKHHSSIEWSKNIPISPLIIPANNKCTSKTRKYSINKDSTLYFSTETNEKTNTKLLIPVETKENMESEYDEFGFDFDSSSNGISDNERMDLDKIFGFTFNKSEDEILRNIDIQNNNNTNNDSDEDERSFGVNDPFIFDMSFDSDDDSTSDNETNNKSSNDDIYDEMDTGFNNNNNDINNDVINESETDDMETTNEIIDDEITDEIYNDNDTEYMDIILIILY